MHEEIKKTFDKNIENHEITIIRSAGVDRHLKFSSPGTNNCSFDILTWDNHLCINGDCGSYLFSRATDMFEFFGGDENHINPSYWGEKLLSISANEGYKEYCPDLFEKTINKWVKDYFVFETDAEKNEVMQEIKEQVLDCRHDGEIRAYDAATDFESSYGHEFEDFECDNKKYTHHYIWCLYAIVYAIKTFKECEK